MQRIVLFETAHLCQRPRILVAQLLLEGLDRLLVALLVRVEEEVELRLDLLGVLGCSLLDSSCPLRLRGRELVATREIPKKIVSI